MKQTETYKTRVLLKSKHGYWNCYATSKHHFRLLDEGWEEIGQGNFHEMEKLETLHWNGEDIWTSFDGLIKLINLYKDFI